MALVSPLPSTHHPQHIHSMGSLRVPGIATARRGIVQEPSPSMIEDKIFVAVAKDVKDSKQNLIWAIQNSGGKKICILYVLVPATMIPLMGAKVPISSAGEQEVQAYRKREVQSMHKTMDEYLLICQLMGVRADKLHIEMDCIEKGIVELVLQHNIRRLVMGAALDKHYSRKMTGLRSRKALYVCEHAPAYCQIQFICKGYLIYTRDRSLDSGNAEFKSPLAPQMPKSEADQSPRLRSRSVALGQNQLVKWTNPAQEFLRRLRSNNDQHGGSTAPVSSPERFSTPQDRPIREGSLGDVLSGCADIDSYGPVLSPSLVGESSEHVLESNLSVSDQIEEDLRHSSPPSMLDGGTNDTLYDKLEQAGTEAENARLDAYKESIRRRKAERDAIDAIRRINAAEIKYKEELNLKKELQEALKKEKEELEKMKIHRERVKEELRLALDQKSSLEHQAASAELMKQELDQKVKSAMDMLQSCKNERDDLKMQRDNALREAEELKRRQGETSTTHAPQLFSEFSFAEIEEATSNFNPSLKIGEGGYGPVYKGILRETEVAIKVLRSENKQRSQQGYAEFQQEVEVLTKLRNPHLITLIGACPESWTLVYEYLPNGSLEDRLDCKDNMPPLSWQTRVRIAAEICSALVFLHSSKPHCIVHADLKPGNVLLNANLVSKLSDFGISRILSHHEGSSDDTTSFWRTDPKGTPGYIDPEFYASGEMTAKSDVYSLGVILLRLLTGKPALGLKKMVQSALDSGKLNSIVDPLAGDWPSAQAEQLAHLALRCCEMSRKDRPDLCSDVWKTLEAMRVSCGGRNSFGLGSSQGLQLPPPYFICPITQEVMQDPHVAADGYTYEAEAIQAWLERGPDTSPVTNSKLQHRNIVPNHALKSAIQDWRHSHS